MEYPTAASFVTLYLNNQNVAANLDSSWRQTNEYAVYMGTKDMLGYNNYPNLFAPPSTTPALLFFHGLKFKTPNGQILVDEFDRRTEVLKANYGIHALARFDVSSAAMCTNHPTPLQLDQIRIEGVRSFGEFGTILQDPEWNDASVLRQTGITEDSFSGFADHNQFVNSIYV
mmetsp:Transcript_29323/g.44743  ORF Transcript_29323/g.44743 Transcript_29323/m.44743 type:complete len:172 (+) Transcript_29323:1-516(+)